METLLQAVEVTLTTLAWIFAGVFLFSAVVLLIKMEEIREAEPEIIRKIRVRAIKPYLRISTLKGVLNKDPEFGVRWKVVAMVTILLFFLISHEMWGALTGVVSALILLTVIFPEVYISMEARSTGKTRKEVIREIREEAC